MNPGREEFVARALEMGKRWNAEDAAKGVPALVAMGVSAVMFEVADVVTTMAIRAGGARTAEYLRLLADQAESLHVAASAPSASAS